MKRIEKGKGWRRICGGLLIATPFIGCFIYACLEGIWWVPFATFGGMAATAAIAYAGFCLLWK